MKGNATCHTFSKQGVANFERITWLRDGDDIDNCPFEQPIGKNRVICKIDHKRQYCDRDDSGKCRYSKH